MADDKEISVSLESLCLLACFTVRETLTTLQHKGLITDADRDTILARAVDGLARSNIALTHADTGHLLNVLMGRPMRAPDRNLN